MGRKRQNGNPLGLEPRVYAKNGQWQYRHRDGSWEKLGTDIGKANSRARVYNDPGKLFGTVGYFIDLHTAEARAGRLLRKLSPRTIADYEVQGKLLKAAFGNMLPTDLVAHPELVTDYRDGREAPVRANRELSQLSAMFSWLIEKGYCPGLVVNPVSLIARNPETPKERYVEDGEYRAVYGIAQRSVCMAMDLVYRTLQRPQDVLAWAPGAIRVKQVAGTAVRVLSVRQAKRGRALDIEVTPELDEALQALSGGRIARLSDWLVHDLSGGRYTVSGIGAMIRRYCKRAGIKTFGLMDIRAKGATDMYLRGVPLEHIQQLMGHKSVQTTEIYIKRLLSTVRIARPNEGIRSASS